MADETVLILANGEWGETSRLSAAAAGASRVIAADGAWAKAAAAGIHVDLVIGDLDSLSASQRQALLVSDTKVHEHPPDKDLTDLELAVDLALAYSATKLVVFGAFGGRIDHALANVFMLEKAIQRGVEVELITGDETAWLARGAFTVPRGRSGDRISLVPLSARAVVRTEGLHYRLDGDALRRTSARGISNVIEKVPARIVVQSGTLLVVHGPADGASKEGGG